MAYSANVINIMVASPGDVPQERQIVTHEVQRWNFANAFARKLILTPIKWETHTTPQLGAPAQKIVNEQILDTADILIGIFGTRIGTPTTQYISGTVEEIKRHIATGKTAKVYFSDAPVSPSAIDIDQYKALLAFKEECKALGLYGVYSDLHQFRTDFKHHLDIELNQHRYLVLSSTAPRMEILEAALLELREKVRGREVTAEQIARLKTLTAARAKGIVKIQKLDQDPEAVEYARQLSNALTEAGWTVVATPGKTIGGTDIGLSLHVYSGEAFSNVPGKDEIDLIPEASSVFYGRVLKEGLASVGIPVAHYHVKSGPPIPRNSVSISVGHKP